MLHCVRRQVLLCAAGETKDHGEIAILHTIHVHGEVMHRRVGHVVGAVIGGVVVGVGIDAEHAEVPRVTRPNPVVRVPTKLAHRRGWRAHETHVAKHPARDEVVAVSKVERHHAAFEPLPFCRTLDDGFHLFLHALLPRFAGQSDTGT